MDLLAAIAGWSVLAFAAFLFVLQTLLREGGYALGRARAEQPPVRNEGAGIITGAILGLLAFVLALTLSVASSRFADRRMGALEEANAISTAWLQAESISHPRAEAIAKLIEAYAEQRVIYISADLGAASIGDSDRATAALQNEIWGNLTGLLAERTDPATAGLSNALTHMFDMTTALRFALVNGLPGQIIWLLLLFTLVGMGVVGYQLGAAGKPNRVLATILSLLWTIVMMVILDVGTARLGAVRADMQAFTWVISGFQDIAVPPLTP